MEKTIRIKAIDLQLNQPVKVGDEMHYAIGYNELTDTIHTQSKDGLKFGQLQVDEEVEAIEMKQRGFEVVENGKHQDLVIALPLRGTKTSAGYDFYTPVDVTIPPQAKVLIWTDVKSYMMEGEVLLLDVRSSTGIKQDLMLANTIGVIDEDYYNNSGNEGNIGICLRNLKPSMEITGYIPAIVKSVADSTAPSRDVIVSIPVIKDLKELNTVVIKSGERVAQGFFINFLEADNGHTNIVRDGGIGSTGKGEVSAK